MLVTVKMARSGRALISRMLNCPKAIRLALRLLSSRTVNVNGGWRYGMVVGDLRFRRGAVEFDTPVTNFDHSACDCSD